VADKATPTAFLSVHFLLAVQKKVNMRFYFLSGRSERKCEGFPLGLARGEMPPAFLGIVAGKIFLWVQIASHSTER